MTMSKDPIFGGIYGEPGVGKSTDLLYSFPCGLFVADPGAMRPAEHVVGYTPTVVAAQTLTDLVALVNKEAGKHDALIVDDFSMLVDRHIRKEGTGKYWDAVYSGLFKFREAARKAGMHVFVNSHLDKPRTDASGTKSPGGMAMPGSLAFNVQATMDLLYRAELNKARKPWGMVYRTQPDNDYTQKCRLGSPDMMPGNVGELLRAGGFELKRLPGLEWQEAVVENLANELAKTTGAPEATSPLLAAAWGVIEAKYTQNQLHVRWTIRDAVDRSVIRRAKAASLRAGFGF